jgi:hypothetical protein
MPRILIIFSFASENYRVKSSGIPYLAKNERDTPNFLYVVLDMTACAPFIKERRMKFAKPTEVRRKSGIWGTRHPEFVASSKF